MRRRLADRCPHPTSILYPDNATVVRYEYDGTNLKGVCEVKPGGSRCHLGHRALSSDRGPAHRATGSSSATDFDVGLESRRLDEPEQSVNRHAL